MESHGVIHYVIKLFVNNYNDVYWLHSGRTGWVPPHTIRRVLRGYNYFGEPYYRFIGADPNKRYTEEGDERHGIPAYPPGEGIDEYLDSCELWT